MIVSLIVVIGGIFLGFWAGVDWERQRSRKWERSAYQRGYDNGYLKGVDDRG